MALAVPWLAAAAYYPVLRRPWRARVAVLVVLSLPVLAAPFLVDPEARFTRFLVATHAVFLICGLYDLHRSVERMDRPGWWRYAAFLGHPLHLVYRRMDDEPGPGRRANLVRLLRAAAEFSVGIAAVRAAFAHAPELSARGGIWLEHAAKILAMYPLLDGMIVGLVAAWRLAGGRAIDAYRDPILSVSPADFWRRYNRVVGNFLFENVARTVGGFRRPVLATMAAFLVSAIIHEYLSTVAIGKVQGYQTAFFLFQGVAVVATQRVDPRGAAARTFWIAGTMAFNIASLALFCRSVDQVADWYSY